MRGNTHKFVRGLALAVALSALAAPVASVAPAAASGYGPPSATPQTAQENDASGVVLRRDGSQAVPFVADLGAEAEATSDGFDWGDAGIGAMLAMFALASIAAIAAGAGLVPIPGGRG